MVTFPLSRVVVAGRSMSPAFRAGDWLLVRRWGRARAGRAVVVRLPDRPLSVKRLERVEADGRLWVLGDDPEHSTDSRQLGALDPEALWGVVVLRCRRGPAEPP